MASVFTDIHDVHTRRDLNMREIAQYLIDRDFVLQWRLSGGGWQFAGSDGRLDVEQMCRMLRAMFPTLTYSFVRHSVDRIMQEADVAMRQKEDPMKDLVGMCGEFDFTADAMAKVLTGA